MSYSIRNIFINFKLNFRFLKSFLNGNQRFLIKFSYQNIILPKSKSQYLFRPLYLGFFPFLNKKDDEEDIKLNKPENLLARAIFAENEGDNAKALNLLHEILNIIKQQSEDKEITPLEYESKKARIYSEMANIYLFEKDYDRATTLLVETMRSCIATGVKYTSALIIELSLKLANVYSIQKRIDDADLGYNYCINNCLKEISENKLDEDSTKNLKALLGMSYDYYSKFLFQNAQYIKSLEVAKLALAQAENLFAENHPNIINLINDIGTVLLRLKDVTGAQTYFEKGIKLCLRHPTVDITPSLSILYANYAQSYMDQKNIDKAEEMCYNSAKYFNVDANKNADRFHIDECFTRLAGLKSEQRED